MRVRIARSAFGVIDGVCLSHLHPGLTYDLPLRVAQHLLDSRVAEPVSASQPVLARPFDHPALERLTGAIAFHEAPLERTADHARPIRRSRKTIPQPGQKSGSIDKQDAASREHFHAVRFYQDDDSLCRIVAGFVSEGLATGQPGVVISTPGHGALIAQQLTDLAHDVQRLQEAGELFLLDAELTMSEFMVEGIPNAARFCKAIVPVLQKASGGRHRTVRAYGEMVDVLWKRGQIVAATTLETLWNQLAASHDFSLLCGYAMGNFYKDAAGKDEVCRHHTHVVSDTGQAAAISLH